MIDYLRKQYWDSCVFINYLTGKNQELLPKIDELISLQESGRISVVISTFVIAEVRNISVPGAKGLPVGQEELVDTIPFDPEREKRVTDMFQSPDLQYVALTPRIAEMAASIGNRYPRLLPPDCVHIASALFTRSDVLFTLDGDKHSRRRPSDMIRYSQKLGTPPLPITVPFVPMGPLLDQDHFESK